MAFAVGFGRSGIVDNSELGSTVPLEQLVLPAAICLATAVLSSVESSVTWTSLELSDLWALSPRMSVSVSLSSSIFSVMEGEGSTWSRIEGTVIVTGSLCGSLCSLTIFRSMSKFSQFLLNPWTSHCLTRDIRAHRLLANTARPFFLALSISLATGLESASKCREDSLTELFSVLTCPMPSSYVALFHNGTAPWSRRVSLRRAVCFTQALSASIRISFAASISKAPFSIACFTRPESNWSLL